MGRLAGFSYFEVAGRLRRLGFELGTLRAVLRQARVTPAAFLDA
jgi:hypothetical protein